MSRNLNDLREILIKHEIAQTSRVMWITAQWGPVAIWRIKTPHNDNRIIIRNAPKVMNKIITIAGAEVRRTLDNTNSLGEISCFITYIYPAFTYVHTFFSYIYHCFSCLAIFTRDYLCLPMFTRVYLCLYLFTYDYCYLLVLTYVLSCLPMFKFVYLCLPLFIVIT